MRPYLKRDLDDLYELTRHDIVPWPKEAIEAFMLQKYSNILVKRSKGQVIAYIAYWKLKTGDFVIARFGVHPEFRDRGLAHEMFQYILTRAQHCCEVRAKVHVQFVEIQKFIRRLGFKCIGEHRRYYTFKYEFV